MLELLRDGRPSNGRERVEAISMERIAGRIIDLYAKLIRPERAIVFEDSGSRRLS